MSDWTGDIVFALIDNHYRKSNSYRTQQLTADPDDPDKNIPRYQAWRHLSIVKSSLLVILNLVFQLNIAMIILRILSCTPETSRKVVVQDLRNYEDTLRAGLSALLMQTISLGCQFLNLIQALVRAVRSKGYLHSCKERRNYYRTQISFGFLDYLARGIGVFVFVLHSAMLDNCINNSRTLTYFLLVMTTHINMEFITSLNVIRRNKLVPNIVYTFLSEEGNKFHQMHINADEEGVPIAFPTPESLPPVERQYIDDDGDVRPPSWYFYLHAIIMTLSILIMSALFVKYSMCLNVIAIMLVVYAFWPK